jgi:hypothetical protein
LLSDLLLYTLAHELRINELALVLRRLDACGSLRPLAAGFV